MTKILFASAELTPLARVGGLAEAAAGLVKELRAQGEEVTLVLPDYFGTDLQDEVTWYIPLPDWCGPTVARRGKGAGVDDVILVANAGLARPHPYVDPVTNQPWPDNDWRFFCFSVAVARLVDHLQPELLHLNDWHAAPTVGFLHSEIPTILTIHTLGYQGVCPSFWMSRIEREPWRFAWYDVCNPLLGAIRSVDKIVTVSPNYAAEILTESQGMGLDAELDRRRDDLVGIRNGIDTSIWNPKIDPHLPASYGRRNVAVGKAASRAKMFASAGWVDDGQFLLGLVSRLVDQKGIKLIAEIVPYLAAMPAKLFILGAGTPELTTLVRTTADARPELVHAVTDRFDEPLAHQIFAGADGFVMPSRFEPCGLAQMQAMAYGTVPIASRVGGLVDTVVDSDNDPDNGTGFLMTTNNASGLLDGIHRAVRARARAASFRKMTSRGMGADWSWTGPAGEHRELYHQLSL